MIKQNILTPFVGLGEVKLMSSLADVRAYLKEKNITFQQELWSNKGCSPEVPWTIIKIDGCVSLFFAFDRLWKIYCERGFEGSLPNGIRIGMPMEKATSIDKSLEYDDWEEDYASSEGYWLGDSVESKEVESISVFIKPALNDEEFFTYDWAK